MRQAVESARTGWGLCTVAGVAGKGETLDVIPRWLIRGRRIAGSSFGGVKGRDQVRELVDRHVKARSKWRRPSPSPSRAVRRTSVPANASPGRHSRRDHVRVGQYPTGDPSRRLPRSRSRLPGRQSIRAASIDVGGNAFSGARAMVRSRNPPATVCSSIPNLQGSGKPGSVRGL
jgi:hypothetical protein